MSQQKVGKSLIVRFTITDILGLTALVSLMVWGTLRNGFLSLHWLLLIAPFFLAYLSARRGSDRQAVLGWLAIAWLVVMCDGTYAFILCFQSLAVSAPFIFERFERRVFDEALTHLYIPASLSIPVIIGMYQRSTSPNRQAFAWLVIGPMIAAVDFLLLFGGICLFCMTTIAWWNRLFGR